MTQNNPDQFERLPETVTERTVPDRPTREELLEWWATRFNVPPTVFQGYSFWEKGAGKIWIVSGQPTVTLRVEALGLRFMWTRQTYWKPTTNAVQRYGHHATQNVIQLDSDQATRFVAGEDQPLDWNGEWGYVIATRDVARAPEPLGVGLYTHGELQSMIPKGRRRTLTK